jgi:hypothetical protein
MRLTQRGSSISAQDPRQLSCAISEYAINNLKAQANGLDLFLPNTSEHPVVIHMHYFVCLTNLVGCRRRERVSLAVVVGEINAL